MNITKQKGTKDIFGNDIKYWQKFEQAIKEVCDSHNVEEIRVPTFEATELFSRSVGDGTDIVTKEMYTFKDRGERSITLRPEFTAGVVRAYIENGFSSRPSPIKLWYNGPVFRYEKMQKGRYREFRQFGVEIFGSSSYLADIETIVIAKEILEKIGLYEDLKLKINSIGCLECRKKYTDILREYLKDKIDSMCDDCKVRYEKNIMRIIDCKEDLEVKKNMPMITDCLCDKCKNDFESLKRALENLNIDYEVDKTIVRGLDYYNGPVFEFASKDLDLSVGGGGRYDGLVELLGGSNIPATGFAFGMDRIVLLMQEKNIEINDSIDLFIVTSGNEEYFKACDLMSELRKMGISCDIDILERSFGAQMKYASKLNAKFAVIIGEEEIKNNMVQIKNMNTGNQITADFDAKVIKKSLEIV